MDRFLSTECRRVKQAVQAWQTNLPYVWTFEKPITTGPIVPVGEPILIWPLEEVHVLRRTRVWEETMALVSWCDRLYLVTDHDLEARTIRVSRSFRH
jgi:hypothetical protein